MSVCLAQKLPATLSMANGDIPGLACAIAAAAAAAAKELWEVHDSVVLASVAPWTWTMSRD